MGVDQGADPPTGMVHQVVVGWVPLPLLGVLGQRSMFDEPPGGHDWSGYPKGLYRPTGNEPRIHHADPRSSKRCTTCGDLGYK